MNTIRSFVPCIFIASLAACAGRTHHDAAASAPALADGWRQSFNVDKATLSPTGHGRYWTLEPGHTSVFTGGSSDRLTIRCLEETRVVDGVTTRVVEEREEKNGALVEISRNFMAIDPSTGDVYYFGEETDMYKNGKVSGHEGSWLSGEKGARFGMLIAGTGRLGDRYQQEIAPGMAMDRVEVVGVDELVKVPAGVYEHCIHVRETTPLEGDVGHKYYAPGVGLVKDDEFVLVSVKRS